jgi:hypothetical protein
MKLLASLVLIFAFWVLATSLMAQAFLAHASSYAIIDGEKYEKTDDVPFGRDYARTDRYGCETVVTYGS